MAQASRTITLKVQLQTSEGSSSLLRSQQRRVHLPANALKQSRLATGDFVIVRLKPTTEARLANVSLENQSAKLDEDHFAIGTAWPSFHSGSQAEHAVHLPQIFFNELPGLSEDSVVDVMPMLESGLRGAEILRLTLSPFQGTRGFDNIDLKDAVLLSQIRHTLADVKCLKIGQIVEVIHRGASKHFVVQDFDLHQDRRDGQIGLFSTNSTFLLAKADVQSKVSKKKRITSTEEAYLAVGGLTQQIEQIRELVELPLIRPELYKKFGLAQPRGLLLHGPAGTGKTLLASTIASSLQVPCYNVSGASLASPYHGETEGRLRDIFERAQQSAPSIIVLDEVDAMAPKREDAGDVDKRVVAELLVLMDGLNSKPISSEEDSGHVMVIACTNRPNAIDAALRRPGRFDREMEIGIPDAESRLSILRVHLRKSPCSLSEEQLQSLAERTHGYVGADLASLVHSAGMNGLRRHLKDGNECCQITIEDFDAALLVVQPSAMREVFLELPKVRWTDIGGQQETIQRLRECVEWPITRKTVFKRLGIKPPAGILLYGPPGCSKTMLARAMATEAGLNFIAVKGPEVFNKYVGESERQIRTLFQKARAASPSILFLDEVDAIATSRTEGGDSSSGDRILTTLLTELDGIEPLQGVVLLCATNRPWSIDVALLRPGRLDRLLYVGLPDTTSRLAILRLQMSKMSVLEHSLDVPRLAELTAGCSGAEITAMCQDAALLAMNEDADASHVRQDHFETAAITMRRRVTSASLKQFEVWREQTSS